MRFFLPATLLALKTTYDEPVWNEDFVKALRISNVQVSGAELWLPVSRPPLKLCQPCMLSI